MSSLLTCQFVARACKTYRSCKCIASELGVGSYCCVRNSNKHATLHVTSTYTFLFPLSVSVITSPASSPLNASTPFLLCIIKPTFSNHIRIPIDPCKASSFIASIYWCWAIISTLHYHKSSIITIAGFMVHKPSVNVRYNVICIWVRTLYLLRVRFVQLLSTHQSLPARKCQGGTWVIWIRSSGSLG